MKPQNRILHGQTIKRQLIRNRNTNIRRHQTRHKATVDWRTRSGMDDAGRSGRLLIFPTKDARIVGALVVHAVVPHVVADLFAAAETGEACGCGEGVCGGWCGDLGETDGGAGVAPFGGVDGAGSAGVGEWVAFLSAGFAVAEFVDGVAVW